MKVQIIDDAGKRVTDGSAIALMILAAAPTIMALIPDGRPPSARDWILVGVAVAGWVFKFVKVVP